MNTSHQWSSKSSSDNVPPTAVLPPRAFILLCVGNKAVEVSKRGERLEEPQPPSTSVDKTIAFSLLQTSNVARCFLTISFGIISFETLYEIREGTGGVLLVCVPSPEQWLAQSGHMSVGERSPKGDESFLQGGLAESPESETEPRSFWEMSLH